MYQVLIEVKQQFTVVTQTNFALDSLSYLQMTILLQMTLLIMPPQDTIVTIRIILLC